MRKLRSSLLYPAKYLVRRCKAGAWECELGNAGVVVEGLVVQGVCKGLQKGGGPSGGTGGESCHDGRVGAREPAFSVHAGNLGWCANATAMHPSLVGSPHSRAMRTVMPLARASSNLVPFTSVCSHLPVPGDGARCLWRARGGAGAAGTALPPRAPRHPPTLQPWTCSSTRSPAG